MKPAETPPQQEAEGLSQKALEIARPLGFPITNSMVVGAGLHPTCLDGLPSGYILHGAIRTLDSLNLW